jgi:Tfp pilus assembly protein PilV
MCTRLRKADERGESLLELVVAIFILGVCVIAIGSGIAGSIMISGLHRQQADASRILHNYAESLKAGSYSPCSADAGASYTLPQQPGFDAPGLAVRYWDGAGFQASCPAPGDQGLQQVTISLEDTDLRVGQSLTIVLRRST